jgi:hypothetical protein
MNAKIVALESKFSDVPSRLAVAAEPRATSNVLLSPSVVNQGGPSSDNDGTTSNNFSTNVVHACSCQSTKTCNDCESELTHNWNECTDRIFVSV